MEYKAFFETGYPDALVQHTLEAPTAKRLEEQLTDLLASLQLDRVTTENIVIWTPNRKGSLVVTRDGSGLLYGALTNILIRL
ncbi:hypothetical protein KBD71_04525 [Candidatus Woesebacteria bacterium]|nr:hypothetical protein [Candidatus Woesebacteria bacterium]